MVEKIELDEGKKMRCMKEGKSEKLLVSPEFKADDKGDATPSRK